ncbi:MAG: metallophosphoesterase [uncultured bacterium]|nr:MAG: metallophosphoesterase [uncultured bacterium]
MISKIKKFVKLINRLKIYFLAKKERLFYMNFFKFSNNPPHPKKRVLTTLSIIIFSFLLICIGTLYYLGYFKKVSDGFPETIEYLHSLPKAEKLYIWSNSENFCKLFNGKCVWGNSIPEYSEFDYFVFFVNQDKSVLTNDGKYSDFKKYASEKIVVKKRSNLVTKAEIVSHLDIPSELIPPPSEFTFAIIGDSQRWKQRDLETSQFYSILGNIKKIKPDFLLAMGDLTPDYACPDATATCRAHYEKWKSEIEKYVPIIYPAMGNHDEANKGRLFYKDVFSLPNNGPVGSDAMAYSLNYKNSLFVFFDDFYESEEKKLTTSFQKQTDWLNQNLKNTTRRNIFFVAHAPSFNRAEPINTPRWKNLFENNVFATFAGHTHVFCQRTATAEEFEAGNGELHHFIIGNSGSMNHPFPPDCEKKYQGPHFAIVKIKGSEMQITIHDFRGNEIAKTIVNNENYYLSK